jgi:uncharacterized protein
VKLRLFSIVLLLALAASAPARADWSPFDSYWENVARAAQKNDAEQVLRLVGTKTNPDQTDDQGRTGLIYAAMNGNMRIAAILIRAGAKLNLTDPLGDTPLHWAVERDQPEVARLLLDAGAAVDPENRDGLTPLMFAARAGNLELVRLLLAKGADPTKTDYTGRDAAGWAQGGRGAAVVQALNRALAGRRQ